jgi:hypothetical protein
MRFLKIATLVASSLLLAGWRAVAFHPAVTKAAAAVPGVTIERAPVSRAVSSMRASEQT